VSGHQGLRRSKETKTKKQKKDMKMRKQIALGAMLLTVGLFGSSSTIVAQTDPGTAWNEQYRTEYEVPLGNYTGRSPYMQGGAPMVRPPAPAPAPIPAPAPAPAPAPDRRSAAVTRLGD